MTSTSDDPIRNGFPVLGEADRRALPMAVIKLMRPHQWTKNAFVAAALFLTPAAMSYQAVWLSLAGIAAFSLVASAVYVLNDLVDRETDRLHPRKCRRPIAAGEVSPSMALSLVVLLLGLGLAASFTLDEDFGRLVAAYFVLNVAYCFVLKRISIVDVLTITTGFVIRVQAGAALLDIRLSIWAVVCTGLVSLFLALAKRRDDLSKSLDASHRAALTGYTKPFIDSVLSIVLGALLIAYILYTTDEAVLSLEQTRQLYVTVPFVLGGILRYLQIALVEERSGAPTVVVLSDGFMIGCIGLWAMAFAWVVYL